MNRFALALALALALAALAACRNDPPAAPAAAAAPPAHQHDQPHALRTYQVPVEHEKQIERLLRDVSYPIAVVSAQGAQTQFAKLDPQLTGSGVIVLSAPLSIHDGVAQLIERVKATKPRVTSTIETTYWAILGWPAKERSIAPDVHDAAPALEALGELGPMRFELLDRVQLAALDGDQATGSSTLIEMIKSTASADGDRIAVRLEVRIAGGDKRTGIETMVAVRPNQFAVLGQAGYTPDKPTLAAQSAGQTGRATLFYLVRARTLP